MNKAQYVTLSLTLATFGIVSEVAIAQPPTSKAVVKQQVSPRALITQVEIAEYRKAIKTAPTHESKMAIREATYAKLRQRAVERGMAMSEPQPWFGGLHWGEVAPLQAQHQSKVKPATLEVKPVALQKVTPNVTKPVVTPHPVAVKSPAPPQTKPVLPHQVIPIMLPHPMKPMLPRIH